MTQINYATLINLINKHKDVATILTGRIFQVILSIITIRVMTEYLSPAEFGRLGILLAILTFIGFILFNPVVMYVNRHLISWNEQGLLRTYIYYFSIYAVIISISVSIITLIIYKFIGLGFEINWLWLILLITLYLLTATTNMLIIPAINILGHRLSFVNLTLLTMLTNLVLSIFLVKLFHMTMEYWLLGQIIGFGIISIISWQIFIQKIQPNNIFNLNIPSIKLPYLLPIIAFALPLSLSVGLNWIQLQSYKFVLATIDGIAVLGLFIAGYSISMTIIGTLESIINQYYMPIFYKNITDASITEQSHAWYRYAALMLPTLIITIVFVIFASPYLAKLLLASSFQGAQNFIIWGALVESIRVLANCISTGAHATLDTHALIIPNFVGAASTAILLFIMNSYMKAPLAAGLSLTISGVLFAAILYYSVNKYIQLRIDFKLLLFAAGLSLPIILVFKIIELIIKQPTAFSAALVICITGILYILAQFITLRQWLKISEKV